MLQNIVAKLANFFGIMQKIYNFFSTSTHRWAVLCKKLKGCPVVKKKSVTRWIARADAFYSLQKNYNIIYDALTTIAEKSTTHTEAEGIIHHLDLFEHAFLTTG
jgi:hypothetical protein